MFLKSLNINSPPVAEIRAADPVEIDRFRSRSLRKLRIQHQNEIPGSDVKRHIIYFHQLFSLKILEIRYRFFYFLLLFYHFVPYSIINIEFDRSRLLTRIRVFTPAPTPTENPDQDPQP